MILVSLSNVRSNIVQKLNMRLLLILLMLVIIAQYLSQLMISSEAITSRIEILLFYTIVALLILISIKVSRRHRELEDQSKNKKITWPILIISLILIPIFSGAIIISIHFLLVFFGVES